MALLDISHVTQTMINLITESFNASPAWPSTTTISVLSEPPNRIPDSATNSVGFYLYHVAEDAHYKNLPPIGNDPSPIRYTPMGLNLYYQLTASHEGTDDGNAAFQEQLMMGIAMKGLHDFPEITDSTSVNGTVIMDSNIRGRTNIFRISLLPVTHNEAVHYWTAGDSPIKLSAYYEASVVLLETEDVQARVSRVLSYGVHTFTEGMPRLVSSQNTISFPFPGEATPRSINLRPAQAPPSPPLPTPSLADSQVVFSGSELTGNTIELLLLNARWDEPLAVDTAFWNVTANGVQFSFTVQQTRLPLPPPAGTVDNDILPGIYAAQLQVTRQRTGPGGSITTFTQLSNQCPFTITPRVDSIAGPVASIFTVTGYVFQHADLSSDDVQVFIGGNRLALTTANPPLAGEFRVDSSTQLRFRIPTEVDPGNVPFRVFINGAESAPRWITVT